MSALPPIADMCSALEMSALCHKRTSRVSLHKQKYRLVAASPKFDQRFDQAA